jgi:two-component system CheB/CheR fusion protein
VVFLLTGGKVAVKKTAKVIGKKKVSTRKKVLSKKSRKKAVSPVSIKKTLSKEIIGRPIYIVGVGASAGGLEAFAEFFSRMSADSGMAFVLVPHLDPTHKSIIGDLLQKYTKMQIFQAKDGMLVEPNCVYIIPPDKNLAILHGILQLIEPAERRGLRHPIDYFFRTLAEDQRERAIAIILSGTGTEGAQGTQAIKGEGGLVFVQDPDSAKYNGMPQSAIDTGLADFILPAEEIPEQLMKCLKRPYGSLLKEPSRRLKKYPDAIQKMFILIRNQTGHDFSLYKPNTIMRRFERRMSLHQIRNLTDYVAFLRENPTEVDMLFKELLIRVTSFFRDAKAFEVLRKKILPNMVKNASEDVPIRVWIPACSTGEEAYSLAILLHEYLSAHKLVARIQMYATDIDYEAIDLARTAVYPESISDNISKERLRRYFTKEGKMYRVRKEIRQMVVFAVQNVIKEPPFSKIDLISCRNMLIYMGAELQKKVMPIFHYSLKPGGFLFLGSSETIGTFSDLFSVIDKKWKIFRSKTISTPHILNMDYVPAAQTGYEEAGFIKAEEKKADLNLGSLTEKILIENYAPPCVITDERGDILYFHGRTGKYLEPFPGKARMNVYEMAREGLKMELRTAMRNALAKKEPVTVFRLQVKLNGMVQKLNVSVRYIREPEHLKGLLMVVFEDVAPPLKDKAVRKTVSGKKVSEKRFTDPEFELQSTREQLQSTIEELEASNEELQSANEELQSSNEEMQSTNEEIETSKEELQSMNEELMTVNSESQNKIEELSSLTDDMNNLLAGTDVATIFVDNDLKIKRFTPKSKKLINVIESDVGRPLQDIASNLEYRDLIQDAEDVLKTLIPFEHEVQDSNGLWYLMRILPYRTLNNVIDGLVISFIDIHEQKRTQSELTDALDYSNGIIETVREPLLILDADLRVLTANEAFYRSFKVRSDETEGRLIYELGSRQWDIPRLRELLEKILPQNSMFQDFEVEHTFPSIGRKEMLLNARRITQRGRGTDMILLAIEDVTEKNSNEQRVLSNEKKTGKKVRSKQ